MKGAVITTITLIFAAAVFVWGAELQGTQVNTNMNSTDQSAYMEYATEMARTNWQFVGGRNRMPLYPAIMSLFHEEGMSDKAFFKRGKTVGIVIGLLVLSLAYYLLSRGTRVLDALTGVLVTAFTVFAFKAAYFQTEILFYGVNLLLFFLLVSLHQEPSIRKAAMAGVVGGVGHLIKASVLPALLLTAVLIVVRGVIETCRRRDDSGDRSSNRSRGYTALNHFLCTGALLLCFIVIVFPYIQTSKRVFGQYFYNVNSTFYIWYDSWKQVKRGTRAHGDRVGWPDMPDEEIPSFQKYIREHSTEDIVDRFTSGFRILYERTVNSYGYLEFVMAYFVALATLFAQNGFLCRSLLHKTHLCTLLFVVGYFTMYPMLYAWYTAIARGNRFVLALFLPAMLLFVRGLSHAAKRESNYSILKIKIPVHCVSPAVLLFLVVYIISIFPDRIMSMYGGD